MEKSYILSSEVLETETPKNEKLGKIVTRKISHSAVVKKLVGCSFLQYNFYPKTYDHKISEHEYIEGYTASRTGH